MRWMYLPNSISNSKKVPGYGCFWCLRRVDKKDAKLFHPVAGKTPTQNSASLLLSCLFFPEVLFDSSVILRSPLGRHPIIGATGSRNSRLRSVGSIERGKSIVFVLNSIVFLESGMSYGVVVSYRHTCFIPFRSLGVSRS